MSEIRNIGAYDLWQKAEQMDAVVRDEGALQKHLTCIDGEWSVIHELALMKQCWKRHGASNRSGKAALAVVDACLTVMLALHEMEQRESEGKDHDVPDPLQTLERARERIS